jgi:glycosyltransferase involved in cell wall biosynthesis
VSEKISIVFCTDGIFPHAVGGMQRHSRLLLEELSTYSDLDITVLHPHEEQVFDPKLGLKEVRIENIDTSKNYLKECKRYSQRVFQQLQQMEFDVVYSQGLSVWDGIEEIADKVIINPHGLEPYQALGLKDKLIAIPFKKVFNGLFKKARYTVSLGGGLTTILSDRASNLTVLPNAVNLPEPAVLAGSKKFTDPQKVLFVSRFASNKGIHILIAAIEQLNKEGFANKYVFNLAGKGPLFEKITAEHQLDNVNFLGFVDDEDLLRLYAETDLFVLPTLFEGMPTVVLEAMANATPIIVTDVGATAELVDDSNGYLIQKNSVAELVVALKEFYQLDKSKKTALAERSLEKVKERFTWQQVAKAHYELFVSMK